MGRSGDDGLPSSQLPRQAQMSTASSTQNLRTTDALTYLKRVKEIFQDHKDKYDEFLAVMKDFKAQRVNTEGVISRVKELFKGHRDLILGFNTFLPNGYKITLTQEDEPPKRKKPVNFNEAMGFVSKIKSRFDNHVYDAFLDILNMYRKDQKSIKELYQEVSVLFQDHADLLVEFTHFLPDTSVTASMHIAQRGRNHNLFGDDKSIYIEKYNDHGWEDADSSDHKRKIARRDDSVDQFYQGMLNPLSTICEKVQERLQDPENYQKFLDCVHSYESKFVTAPQFRMLVGTILGAQPDLMDGCEDFITYVEKTGCMRNSKQICRPLKVEERDGEHHDRENRNKNKDPSTKERDRYDRGLAVSTKDSPSQKFYSCPNKEKYLMKPIQELDLSNCDSCTPSYRLLPENCPIQSASCRTEIGAKVLNDHWVSVTSGSEDYSFKHMRKNQYEESLFRCEDDRFELDMLLESVNATTLRVEELLDSMNAHTNKIDSTFFIEDHLTALHLRCIERLYGDHGLDVMDVLRKNAPLALPVILTRLKQKQEEWARCRADFNKVWAEIYAKNYHKSLDHRSFYFKQQDAKNLSAKALLAEIKEMSEKNQNEDEMILSIAAGHRQPIRPDMEFEYPDPEIQEDLYQLMNFSCEEVCTPEQCDKVMNIWTSLETVLGIRSRHDEVGPTEDFKANDQKDKNVANIGEGSISVDMSKSGDGDNGSKSDNCPKMDNVCSGSDILCNASQSGEMGNDDIEQAGFIVQGTACAFGEPSVINETASDMQTGPEGIGCGIEAKPGGESQVNVTTKPTPISTEVWPEAIKTNQCNEETEACTSTKASKNPTKETGGEEMCVDEAEAETDAIVDDEGSGSAQGTSDCENVSENGDVSASESADGEECSPEEPDEDGAHNKAESEGEADDDMADDRDSAVMHSPDRSLHKMKPLNMKIPMASLHGKEKGSEIFYGSDSFYILFRLHQILYERMRSAKLHSTSPENKWRILNDANSTDSYARFKDALHSLLNGSSDNAKFEDDCRAIIGAQSYVLFTLDKLIQKLVKQLQVIATEEVDNRLLQLYAYERSRNPENFVDAVYHENARFILPEDNLYRIECLHYPARLTMQLMKNEIDKPEVTAVSMDPNFAAYLNDELLSDVHQRKGKPGVFLMRNKRKLLTGDEIADTCKVMEGLIVYNGLEIKISCNTYKAAYVLDTEDFLYRPRRARKALYGNGASNGVSNGSSRRRKHKLMFS